MTDQDLNILLAQGKKGMQLSASQIYLPVQKITVDKAILDLTQKTQFLDAKIANSNSQMSDIIARLEIIEAYIKDPTIPTSLIGKTSWTELNSTEWQYFLDDYYNNSQTYSNIAKAFFKEENFGAELKTFYFTKNSVRYSLNFVILDKHKHPLYSNSSIYTAYSIGMFLVNESMAGENRRNNVGFGYLVDDSSYELTNLNNSSSGRFTNDLSTQLKTKILSLINTRLSDFDDPTAVSDFLDLISNKTKTISLSSWYPNSNKQYGRNYPTDGYITSNIESTFYMPSVKEISGSNFMDGIETKFIGSDNYIDLRRKMGSGYLAGTGVISRDSGITEYYAGNRQRRSFFAVDFYPSYFPPDTTKSHWTGEDPLLYVSNTLLKTQTSWGYQQLGFIMFDF